MRYRDEPARALTQFPGLLYLAINGLAAVAALAVIRAFDWRFGLAADASEAAVSTLQVLVAGLAAAALFRTSLFTVRAQEHEVGIGPSALLDGLLRTVDRAVDRRRGIARLAIVDELASDLTFERDAPTLAAYAVAGLQNVSLEEADAVGSKANTLGGRDDLPDEVKIRLFALDLMNLVGEKGLSAAIARLNQAEPSATQTNGEALVVEPEPAVVMPPDSDARLDERIAQLKRVIELSPEFAEPHLELGRAQARRAQSELIKPLLARSAALSIPTLVTARANVEAALRLHPTFVDAHLELGRILTIDDDDDGRDRAEASVLTALRLSDSPEMEAAASFQLAVLAKLRGAPPADWLRWLDAAVATGAAKPEWRLACAAAHARLGSLEAATRRAEAIVEQDPDDRTGWVLLGLLHLAGERAAASAEALTRAAELVDLGDFDVDSLQRLGEGIAYHRIGESDRAVATLAKELTTLLPGVRSFVVVGLLTEQEPWRDLNGIARELCDGVLVPRVGDPVMRSRPSSDPRVPLTDAAS